VITFYSVLALLAAVGVLMLGASAKRLRQRRRFAAVSAGTGGGMCLALAALAGAILLNLHTYQRLSYEQPVAALHFVAVGDQHFQAALTTPDARLRLADMRGDEWQLDARVLKWQPLANLFGFDALFRLERLSGRYRDIADENGSPRSAVALGAGEPGLNTFSLARRMPRWAGLVDAEYGSATYLPMADGAAYDITLSQSGLVARPANDAASEAMRRW
jgi:hypothetical protein